MTTLSKDTSKKSLLANGLQILKNELKEKLAEKIEKENSKLDREYAANKKRLEKNTKKLDSNIDAIFEACENGTIGDLSLNQINEPLSELGLSEKSKAEYIQTILSKSKEVKVVDEEEVEYEEETREEIVEDEEIKEEPEEVIEEESEPEKEEEQPVEEKVEEEPEDSLLSENKEDMFAAFENSVSGEISDDEISGDEILNDMEQTEEVTEATPVLEETEDTSLFSEESEEIKVEETPIEEETEENVEDSELDEKRKYIKTVLGKTDIDISLVPEILTKYKTLDALKNAVEEKTYGGVIDPKELSLVYFVNGSKLTEGMFKEIKTFCDKKDRPEKFLASVSVANEENIAIFKESIIEGDHLKPSTWKALGLSPSDVKRKITKAESLGFIEAYKQNPNYLLIDEGKIIKRIAECDAKGLPYISSKGKYQPWLFSDRAYEMMVPSENKEMKKEEKTNTDDDALINNMIENANHVMEALTAAGIDLEDKKQDIYANIMALTEQHISDKEILATAMGDYVDSKKGKEFLSQIIEDVLENNQEGIRRA